jgi:hypothetical protein
MYQFRSSVVCMKTAKTLKEKYGICAELGLEYIEAFSSNQPIACCLIEIDQSFPVDAITIHVAKIKDAQDLKIGKALIAMLQHVVDCHQGKRISSWHSLDELNPMLMLLDLGATQIGHTKHDKPAVLLKYPKTFCSIKTSAITNESVFKKILICRWLGLQAPQFSVAAEGDLLKLLSKSPNIDLIFYNSDKIPVNLGYIVDRQNRRVLLLVPPSRRSDYVMLSRKIFKHSVSSVTSVFLDGKLTANLNILGLFETYHDNCNSLFEFTRY